MIVFFLFKNANSENGVRFVVFLIFYYCLLVLLENGVGKSLGPFILRVIKQKRKRETKRKETYKGKNNSKQILEKEQKYKINLQNNTSDRCFLCFGRRK